MQPLAHRKFPPGSLLGRGLLNANLNARRRASKEVTAEDLLAGCLQSLSHLGIVLLSDLAIDLSTFGVPSSPLPDSTNVKAEYSQDALEVLHRATDLASAEDPTEPGVEHLLACFSETDGGLMGQIKQVLAIDGMHWRIALARHYTARLALEPAAVPVRMERTQLGRETPEYLSPEEAAILLGVHVQTLRAYIRSGKLPALRVAGERVLRIRSADLGALLEPLQPEP